jgi:photosystem II stability/assembly factor-like uncharacterized protein
MIVGTRLFATHDGGRRWQRMTSPCPAHQAGRLYSDGATALWAMCSPPRGPSVLRLSEDGGVHWATLPARVGGVDLQPASAQVAWALTTAGQLLRTGDGGRTWAKVWYGGRPEPALLGGRTPVLIASSPTTATVIAQVTRGRVDGHAAQTDFVTYRTTDGGRTWHPSVVRLPAG